MRPVLDSLSQSVHVKPENLRLAEVSVLLPFTHRDVCLCSQHAWQIRVQLLASVCVCSDVPVIAQIGGVLRGEAWLEPDTWAMHLRVPSVPCHHLDIFPLLVLAPAALLQLRSLGHRTSHPPALVLLHRASPSCFPQSVLLLPGSVLFLSAGQRMGHTSWKVASRVTTLQSPQGPLG